MAKKSYKPIKIKPVKIKTNKLLVPKFEKVKDRAEKLKTVKFK